MLEIGVIESDMRWEGDDKRRKISWKRKRIVEDK